MPVVLCDHQSVGGFQPQGAGPAQPRPDEVVGDGAVAEPAEPPRGRSRYSNLSDCHFHGEERHRCRNAAAWSAGPPGARGPRRFLLSHAAISTVYARGRPGRTNIA